MRHHQETRSGSRGARLLLWAERLLLIAGAATLVWCAVLVGDAVIAQRSARSSLAAALRAERPALPPAPERAAEVLPPDPTVHTGWPIAALSIPRVRLSAVVLHGSDAQTLRRGPGHLENTAFPGESGNVVIAGHRDSFFGPLRNITRGDDIFLDTPKGQFHYQVTSLRVVDPRDVSVLAPTDEAILTLVTCYPFWVFGPAPDRFVVRAAAVVEGAAAPIAPHRTPRDGAVGAAVIDASGLRRSVDPEVSVVDDESLVRLAVEHYRLIYNGRLVSRRDLRSAGPVRFETCAVAVADDRATATCETSAQSWSEPEPRIRTFILERAAGGWAVKSIVLDAIDDLPSSR